MGEFDLEKYFVLHAPRQTGKTSCLLALMNYLKEKRSIVSSPTRLVVQAVDDQRRSGQYNPRFAADC